MTLCLAAEGWLDNAKQCIAFCCDMRESAAAYQESVERWRGRYAHWKQCCALLSGAETIADRTV